MIDTLQRNPEFEQKPLREVERKLMPVFPEDLVELREQARPIEQYYLSHPTEPFSLRLRETFDQTGALTYMATLKDRGELTVNGLDRLEVEAQISPQTYLYYKANAPTQRKLRAQANNDVSVDFYEDGRVLVESEDPIAWTNFCDRFGADFVDVTGDRTADNEWLAHLNYRRENSGQEALQPQPELNPNEILNDIFEQYTKTGSALVKICGRSGSGKSTIVRQIQVQLAEYGLASEVISTDDYHRGDSWLRHHNGGQPWTEWDHPVVYDTALMAENIRRLQAGQAIPRRWINFETVEPAYDGEIQPVPILIIEGIYAGHEDLSGLSALQYDTTTPLATCVGRRLLRDLRERPQFADPVESLKYMLEQAEPMWRAQGAAAV